MKKWIKKMVCGVCALSAFAFSGCDLLGEIGGVTSDPYGSGSIFSGNYVSVSYEKFLSALTTAEQQGNGDVLGNCLEQGGASIELDMNLGILVIAGNIHILQTGNKQTADADLTGKGSAETSKIKMYNDGAYTYTYTVTTDADGKVTEEKEKESAEGGLFGEDESSDVKPLEMFAEYPTDNTDGATVQFLMDETDGKYIKFRYECTQVVEITEEEEESTTGSVAADAVDPAEPTVKTGVNTVSVCLVYDKSYNLVAMYMNSVAAEGGHLKVSVQPWTGTIKTLPNLSEYKESGSIQPEITV